MSKCLIVIDVQNDFCPQGALPVPNGDEVVPIINFIMDKFDKVIATQDWHPVKHISFASTHNKNVGDVIEFNGISQVLWPEHCLQGSYGAEFHPKLNTKKFNLILRKGMNVNVDSYSAFLENDKKTETGLKYWLEGLGIREVYLCGLALDYCVFYSACDAVKFGFKTFVLKDATRAVDIPSGNLQQALKHMQSIGVEIISYEEL